MAKKKKKKMELFVSTKSLRIARSCEIKKNIKKKDA